jgi:hypothetical protein
VVAASHACWILRNWADIAATPDKRRPLQIGRSSSLTNESGFIITLVASLVAGNCSTRACSAPKEAIWAEIYIKTPMGQANLFRANFFRDTFFAIKMFTNFRKLWEESIAKFAAVYALWLQG